MVEMKRKINIYEVSKDCEKCKLGKMVGTDGTVLTSKPPKIPHRCSNCGTENYFNKTYPSIVFE